MPTKFLIEVPHGRTMADCAHSIDIFFRTGSHFLTHADWGCKDGVHKAWFIAEVESKEEARNIVPVEFRSQATVVQLNAFTPKDLAWMQEQHKG